MWPALWKEVDTLLSSQDRGFVYVIWNIFPFFSFMSSLKTNAINMMRGNNALETWYSIKPFRPLEERISKNAFSFMMQSFLLIFGINCWFYLYLPNMI